MPVQLARDWFVGQSEYRGGKARITVSEKWGNTTQGGGGTEIPNRGTRQAGVDKRSLLIVNLFVDLCPIYLPLS